MSVIAPVPAASLSAPAAATKPRRDWVVTSTFAAFLAATAALYLVGLSASGYANSFYSAAAQAGSQSWSAWFFGALDSAGAITVDKPPAALWIMGLSVRLFGLNSWSILAPEALLGVASVAVVYAGVRRVLVRADLGGGHGLPPRASHWAALFGAAAFALTPVATLMFRFNNPDALLVFCLVSATYATLRASEKGARGWLVLAGVAVGFGFLTKMMQALIVLPALVLAYVIAAPVTWRRKLVDLLAAFAAVIVSAGWYVAIFELTPANLRPYMGGTQTNSFLELVFGYNGFGRIFGTEVGSVGQRGPGSGQGSWTRMFDGVSGGMVSWLIPAALLLAVAGVALLLRRRPDAPARVNRLAEAAIAAYGGSLLITGVIFSRMQGIYHDYYTVALSPFIGATVALGAAVAWAQRDRLAARLTLAAASLLTGWWALTLAQRATGIYVTIGWLALTVSALAALGFLYADKAGRLLATAILTAATIGGLAGPTSYALNTAATPHTGSLVYAGPVQGGGPGGGGGPARGGFGDGRGMGRRGQMPPMGNPPTGNAPAGVGPSDGGGRGGLLNGATVSTEMERLLATDAESYTWVAAAVGSQNAASYQLATQLPVMALGGFNGSDPSPTLEQFKQLVAEGRIHYLVGGDLGGQQNGGSEAATEIVQWVTSTFEATTVGNTTVYDLTQK